MKHFRQRKYVIDAHLGPVYTEHQRQRCDNSPMMLAILLSLKTMELLQNGVVATHLSSDSIVYNEKSITSVIAELS